MIMSQMVEDVAGTWFTSVLKEAIANISEKIVSGKKVTNTEIIMLMIYIINRRQEAIEKRIDDLKAYVDKSIDEINKKFKDVK